MLQWHPEENVSWWRGLEERPVPSSQVMAVGPGQNKESYILRLFFREKFPGWISGTTTARRSNLVLRIRKQYILTWTSAEDRLGPRKPARGFQKPARGFRITARGLLPAFWTACRRQASEVWAWAVHRGGCGPRHRLWTRGRSPTLGWAPGPPPQPAAPTELPRSCKNGLLERRVSASKTTATLHSSLGSSQAILFSPAPCEPALPACIWSHRAHSAGLSALFVSLGSPEHHPSD